MSVSDYLCTHRKEALRSMHPPKCHYYCNLSPRDSYKKLFTINGICVEPIALAIKHKIDLFILVMVERRQLTRGYTNNQIMTGYDSNGMHQTAKRVDDVDSRSVDIAPNAADNLWFDK